MAGNRVNRTAIPINIGKPSPADVFLLRLPRLVEHAAAINP
jgi:hypothetical protein